MDERRLAHGDRVAHRGKGGDRLPDPQGDARVGDGFEFRALPRIRKDDRAELFPVDPTVGQQEIASEPPDNVGVGGLSREGDLPRDPVRVHDGNSLLPEEPGHGALPGAYPPCQAENTHAANDTTGGNSYLPSAVISRDLPTLTRRGRGGSVEINESLFISVDGKEGGAMAETTVKE